MASPPLSAASSKPSPSFEPPGRASSRETSDPGPHSSLGGNRIRPRTTWASEEEEFDRQQRLVHCHRTSYQRGARVGSVALALGYAGVMAYTYLRGKPRMQTKSMLLAMIFTAGFWVGMEQQYLQCQMRMAREMAEARGLTGVDEDIYV